MEVCSGKQNHTHVIQFLAELCLTFDPKWSHPDSDTPAGGISTPITAGATEKFVLQCEEEDELLKTGVKSSARKGRTQLENALRMVLEAGLEGVDQRESVGNINSKGGEGERWRDELGTTWAALVCVQYIRCVCVCPCYLVYMYVPPHILPSPSYSFSLHTSSLLPLTPPSTHPSFSLSLFLPPHILPSPSHPFSLHTSSLLPLTLSPSHSSSLLPLPLIPSPFSLSLIHLLLDLHQSQ